MSTQFELGCTIFEIAAEMNFSDRTACRMYGRPKLRNSHQMRLARSSTGVFIILRSTTALRVVHQLFAFSAKSVPPGVALGPRTVMDCVQV